MLWLALFLFCLTSNAAEPVFSHKTHAPLKLPCTTCHAGAVEKARAGFPPVSQCHTCHKDYAGRIPAQRVYKLADFVFFSHSVHVKAKAECSTCHGDVSQQATIQIFRDVKMKDCVDCHKEKHATEVCTVCHELGQ
ncbi:MAG: hypothetical protein JNL98_11020 [Bryobacterales bacterium]|nr:hypothetical protein [Bryobacterales bacterium]